MAWLVQTFCKVLLGACAEIFALFSDDLIMTFGINIGGNFPTVKSQLSGSSPSLATILADYPDKGSKSAFDVFFGLSDYKYLFVSLALVLATVLLIKELTMAMAAPLVSGQKQRPVITVLRYMGSIVGIVCSYRIFLIMEFLMNEFYIAFAKVAVLGVSGGKGSKGIETMTESTRGIYMGFFTGFQDYNWSVSKMVVSELANSIMSLVVTWLLLVGFIKLVIEIIERYVVLGMLFYTSPVPFASLVSENSSDIFKAWLRMAFSEMLLIVTNSLFLGVFIRAVSSVSLSAGFTVDAAKKNAAALTKSPLSWLVMMFMLIAWLQLAQNFDAYLKSLGLSTAQTGGGLATAAVAGFTYLSGKAGRMATNGPTGTAVKQAWKTGGVAGVAGAAKGLGSGGKQGAQLAADNMKRNKDMKNALEAKGYSDLGKKLFDGKATETKDSKDLANSRKALQDFGAATGLSSRPGYNNMVNNAKSVSWDGKGGVSIKGQDGSVNRLSVAPDAKGATVGQIKSTDNKTLGQVKSSVKAESPNSTASQFASDLGGDRQLSADSKVYAAAANKTFGLEGGDQYKVGTQMEPIDGMTRIYSGSPNHPDIFAVSGSKAGNYGTPLAINGDTFFYEGTPSAPDAETEMKALKEKGGVYAQLADNLYGNGSSYIYDPKSEKAQEDMAAYKEQYRETQAMLEAFGEYSGVKNQEFSEKVKNMQGVTWDGDGGVTITTKDGESYRYGVSRYVPPAFIPSSVNDIFDVFSNRFGNQGYDWQTESVDKGLYFIGSREDNAGMFLCDKDLANNYELPEGTNWGMLGDIAGMKDIDTGKYYVAPADCNIRRR